ncbi:hypothetical protein RB195_015617 [Necator americanus]|uniref:Protein kinase domain-containing protein n=1 Tax=Necator americanus TaxID=51031 RepID=A0ABR1E5J8_NECAM
MAMKWGETGPVASKWLRNNFVCVSQKAESKSQAERVLKMERNVLQGFKGVKGTVQLISMGTTDTYSYIVMTLCGADLTRACSTVARLTDGTILRLAIGTLLSLKQLHEIGFVHRDVKPCNFATSRSNTRAIHVFDFGMTRKYAAKNEKNEWFIKRRRTRVLFRGTLRYCSLAVHHRVEQGRVDDLWSWVYMIVELRDKLPWAHLLHPEAVQAVKEETPHEKLCSSETSQVFIPVMKHFQSLGYFDRPDYNMIFETILKEMKKRDMKVSDPYDWEGKISDPGVEEKVAEVCIRLGVKVHEDPKTACTEDSSETSELGYLRHAFAPHPTDVPGGEKYEEKRKKGTVLVSGSQNNADVISAPGGSSQSDMSSSKLNRQNEKLASSKLKKATSMKTKKEKGKGKEK